MEHEVDECFEFAKERLEATKWDESVLLSPIPQETFADGLVNGQWRSNSENKEYELRLQDIAIKKLFLEGSKLSEDERVIRFAVIMDLCHHLGMRGGEDSTRKLWTSTYFELFKQALSLFCLPQGHLKFWPYVETRIHWFQSGYSPEVKYGQTNLSAIKAPFSKITFHINKLLLTMREQSKLSTPLHYKLGTKIHWFLSQCLSPMEQANTNRRGNFAKSLPEQLWDTKVTEAEDAPAFFSDLRKVEQQFVSDPLGWAFTDPSRRLSLERYLLPVIDEILLHESYFYAQIKRKNLRMDRLKHKLHSRVPVSSGSTAINKNTTEFKKISSSSDLESTQDIPFTVRPLMLDQPSWDPELVLSRLQDPINDFFRKQVVIQLVIASNLVERVLKDDSIKAFYLSQHYQNVDLSNIDRHSEKSLKDIGYFIKDRVRRFYEQRDVSFQHLLENMLLNEDSLLELKAKRGFKIFSTFTFPEKSLSDLPSPNYTFKGFGWSKFGNKKLDAAWKTETGLQNIKMNAENAQSLFEELQAKHKEEDAGVLGTAHHDTVKQWRQMRVLRPHYIFQLGKVDERTGMEGLFNENAVIESQNDKKELRMKREEEDRKAHDKKLEEARSYFEMKTKRPIDMVNDESLPPSKRQTPDSNSNSVVADGTTSEKAASSEDHTDTAHQLPERTLESTDANVVKPSSENEGELKSKDGSDQQTLERVTESHGNATTNLQASPERDDQIQDKTEVMASESSPSTENEGLHEAASKS
ncbi:LAQU0S28e00188g1_1 [Lachancea quebecensis]|uniref:LAQU0S28e00188g1_1 n=1 Tax=Lachancea quebecensis TaxID=1654605 RepID=A0A0P1L3Z0_9SACH|nr:LAQU0S28e00188g1_1 [Lachancea quebecensis]